MIGNPILARELLGQLRSRSLLLAILVIAITSGALVVLRWPADATADVLSRRSREVFRPLVYCLTAATILLVPAFPATSIVRERTQRTLPLLMLAPINAFTIYAGKFIGNVLLATVLLSATWPAVAASYAMGGVSLHAQLIPLAVVLLCMTLQYTAVALWVSSRTQTSDASLRWSYAAVLGLAVVTMGPAVILAGTPGWLGQAADWSSSISPLPAIQQITGAASATGLSGMEPGGWLLALVIATAIVVVVSLVLTVANLRPAAMERVRATGLITEDQSLQTRVFRRVAYVVDPNRRSRGIPRFVNPVMVKEFRTRRFGRFHWLLRLVAICAVVSMALAVIATTGAIGWGVARIAGALVIFQMVLLVLIGPSLASSLIAGERESGGWQILQMTPISPVRILLGKLFSVAWTLGLILMATLPGYLLMVWIEPERLPQVLRILACLAVTALMVLSISAFVSALCRRTAVATAINYALLLLIFAGTLLVWTARDQPFGQQWVERALMFNPTAAALVEIGMPGFESYQLLPDAWWIGSLISVAALVGLCIQTWRLSRAE